MEHVAAQLAQPNLLQLIGEFLYDQLYADEDHSAEDVQVANLPIFHGRVSVYYSAKAFFYAPSEISGTGGMHSELIRSNPLWRNQYHRFDTILVDVNPEVAGFRGMLIGCVLSFIAFTYHGIRYPCALVQWFVRQNENPNPDTGMWIVEPELRDGKRVVSLIHLDCISRAVHLMPLYRGVHLPHDFHFSYSLDAFRYFYVNKYADYHSHESII